MTENKKYDTKDLNQLFSQLKKDKVTEFFLHDNDICENKERLLSFFKLQIELAGDVFCHVPVNPKFIDREFAKYAMQSNCSLDIPFGGNGKDGKYLFDKKFFSQKAKLLNDSGLVFGFLMDFAIADADSVRNFRDRFDFAFSLYPNHIDFPQFEDENCGIKKSTAVFSTQDIDNVKRIAFAALVFYTFGRAVPWFNSVLQVLKVSPSKFFQDFSEWQELNNCSFEDFKSGRFDPAKLKYQDILRMQLNFLELKFDEKNKKDLFLALNDIVKINGAFSKCCAEGEESVLDLSYSPQDLLGYESQNIGKFVENVCMEHSKVKIFVNKYGDVDFKILN